MNIPADTAATEGTPAAHPRYEGGWRIAVIYFGLISLGFAQPLFEMISLYRRQMIFDFTDAVLIVFVSQYLAAAVLTGFRRLLRARGLRLALDYLVIAGAALMMLRQVQLFYLDVSFMGVADGAKIIIIAAVFAALAAAAVFFRRVLRPVLFYTGAVSPVFGLFFMFSMMTHPLPLSGGGASAPAAAGAGPAVVLAVPDQLSTEILRGAGGGIDAGLFPNFARLAARGIWWKNAITNYPLTKYSFVSFLTSTFPAAYSPETTEDLEQLPAHNLLDVFRNAGYRIHIHTNIFGCADRRFNCLNYLDAKRPDFMLRLLARFFDYYRTSFMTGGIFPDYYVDFLTAENDHLIETVRTAEPGNFHFLHLMTTHDPYFLGPDGSYESSPRLIFHPPVMGSADFIKKYRNQVRYMDKIIGEMLDAMDSRADGNPPVVMLISDHGDCWTEACPGRAAGDSIRTITPSLVNVPAMLLSPSAAPRVDEDDFQLIDVMPTLCEAAGVEGCRNQETAGVSRLHSPPPARPRRFSLRDAGVTADIPVPAAPVHVD